MQTDDFKEVEKAYNESSHQMRRVKKAYAKKRELYKSGALTPEQFQAIQVRAKEYKQKHETLRSEYQRLAVEQTAVEQTAVEQTAVEQTAVEQTAVEQTAVEQTAVEQTAVEQTAVEQTAVEQTAVEVKPRKKLRTKILAGFALVMLLGVVAVGGVILMNESGTGNNQVTTAKKKEQTISVDLNGASLSKALGQPLSEGPFEAKLYADQAQQFLASASTKKTYTFSSTGIKTVLNTVYFKGDGEAASDFHKALGGDVTTAVGSTGCPVTHIGMGETVVSLATESKTCTSLQDPNIDSMHAEVIEKFKTAILSA
jgi:myosin heavy subunit